MIAVQAAQATLEHMISTNGYDRLQQIGSRVVDTFNLASRAADTLNLVTGRTVFGGSMFDLDFAPEILGDNLSRDLLCSCFAENRILLLHGHPSFVCLAHEELDFERLEQSFSLALRQWKQSIDRNLTK